MQGRADQMLKLMGGATPAQDTPLPSHVTGATGMPGRSKGGGGGGSGGGGSGLLGVSIKDVYQPGNRHFSFPPVRAARARKAALGSDFEIYFNLTMEHVEKSFPWTKAYLHDVSPRSFGMAVCLLALILGSVVLYAFLGLSRVGADYYRSLTPTPPPPPPNLVAPVNPLRGVAGEGHSTRRDGCRQTFFSFFLFSLSHFLRISFFIPRYI